MRLQKAAVFALLAACGEMVCAGCGQPRVYRIKTTVPWPDEWAVGARQPYHRALPVSEATVRWHHDADVEATARTIEERLAAKRSVFGFVRNDFARRRSDLAKADPRALRYVEARLVPVWLLPVESQTTGAPAKRTGRLHEVAEGLATVLGRPIAWPEGLDLQKPAAVADVDDAREALMRLLLVNDLFIRCDTPPPRVFRSLEYRSRSEFLAAIDAFAEAAADRPADQPIRVLPLSDWALDYVNRVCGGLEGAPFSLPGKQMGLLVREDLDDESLGRIKRQLEATLAYHVR